MIVVTKGDKKIVLLVCQDKASGKYRSVNVGARTIAPQLYDSVDQLMCVLKKSLEEGKIDNLAITDEFI